MSSMIRLATSPAPLIHARDARDAGLHPEVRDTAIRVRKGVYTSRARWEALPDWHRYLTRVHAFARTRPGAVFSHESAAALWSLPLFGQPRDIHVFDARRSRSLRYGDVTVHTSEDRRTFDEHDGIRVTTPADTVLDLARCLPPAFALAIADSALRSYGRDVTVDGLRSLADRQRDIRGRARISWTLDRADARSESVGESVSRAVIEWWGFAAPELQRVHVVRGRTYRSDFSWGDARVIGEFDGWSKYRDGAEDAHRVMRAEKQRENDLTRAGWTVARWSFDDVIRGTGLRDALLSAGLRACRPPQTARLHMIGHNSRSLPATPPPDKRSLR